MPNDVLAMRFGSIEAEGILRDALSQCSEIRARGKTPYLVVLLGEDEHLPQLGRTQMFTVDMLSCAKRLEIEATEHFREMYEEPVE